MLFVLLWRIPYENQYMSHPLNYFKFIIDFWKTYELLFTIPMEGLAHQIQDATKNESLTINIQGILLDKKFLSLS